MKALQASVLSSADMESSTEVTDKTISLYQQFRAFFFMLILRRNHDRRTLQFEVGSYFIAFWLLACLIPFFIFYFVKLGLTPTWLHCYGCLLDMSEFIFYLVMVLFLFSCGIIVAYSLWKQNDPLGLLKEFILIWVFGATFAGFALIFHISDPGGVQKVHGSFIWRWFELLAVVSMVFFQTSYQVFSLNRFKAKLNTVDFHVKDIEQDILADPKLKGLLKTHMQEELSIEVLNFIDDVVLWKATYKSKKDGMQRNARRIFDTYIANRSPQEVNISANCRLRTTQLCERGNVELSVFDDAQKETMELFERDILPRFLRSNRYRNYQQNNNQLSTANGKV